jgi:transposase
MTQEREMPYSVDLRKRVVSAVREGMGKAEVCELFNICRQTLYNWLALEKEQGHLKAKNGYQNGHSDGIKDRDEFKKYVDAHPDQTQEEMGKYFSVGSSTISRTLQRIGYSRKKRITLIQKEKKNSGMHLRKK